MAKNYHNELSKIVGKQSDYPFASAGINVTLIIMNDFLKLSAGDFLSKFCFLFSM